MKKLFLVILVAVMTISLILIGCAPAPSPKPSPAPAPAPAPEKVIELKFGHQNPPTGHTTVKYLDPWAKKVEEACKGKVKITTYPAESLFKAREVIEATVGGVADIAWVQVGYFAASFPLTSVMSLPFLCLDSGKIDGKERSGGAVNSHILQELYETFPEVQAEWKNVKCLFVHCTDPYKLFTTKKPVRTMDDLRGLKLRELAGPPTEMWKLLGASPMMLPAPDIYEAASKGVIDGNNAPWAMVATYKLFEVFKYWTAAPTSAGQFAIIMNAGTWNKLPPDVQKAIMSVSGYSGAQFAGDGGWGFEARDIVLEAAKKAGYTLEKIDVTPAEFAKWKEIAGKPLWDKWVKDMEAKGLPGQKVLDKTLSLLDKYK